MNFSWVRSQIQEDGRITRMEEEAREERKKNGKMSGKKRVRKRCQAKENLFSPCASSSYSSSASFSSSAPSASFSSFFLHFSSSFLLFVCERATSDERVCARMRVCIGAAIRENFFFLSSHSHRLINNTKGWLHRFFFRLWLPFLNVQRTVWIWAHITYVPHTLKLTQTQTCGPYGVWWGCEANPPSIRKINLSLFFSVFTLRYTHTFFFWCGGFCSLYTR